VVVAFMMGGVDFVSFLHGYFSLSPAGSSSVGHSLHTPRLTSVAESHGCCQVKFCTLNLSFAPSCRVCVHYTMSSPLIYLLFTQIAVCFFLISRLVQSICLWSVGVEGQDIYQKALGWHRLGSILVDTTG